MEISWKEELRETVLPDARYLKNFTHMAEKLEENTDLSFSAACGRKLRKSAHRLFSHGSLDLQSGHREQLNNRVSDSKEAILVIEDTTDLNYGTHKCTKGLGDIGGGKSKNKGEKYIAGLSMHVAMVSTQSGLPLGILGNHIWSPVNETRKSSLLKNLPIEEKESMKWIHTLDWVRDRLKTENKEVFIVGDREGDFYEHYSLYKERKFSGNVHLVVRLLHKQRNILYEGEKIKISTFIKQLEVQGERKTIIRHSNGKKGREVIFDVSYEPIVCPASTGRQGPDIPMFLVKAREQNPVEEQEALEWIILTTKEIHNLEQAISILEIYEKRWSIERFFYVLKQSLRVEKMQFDNSTRLTNALSLYNMIAWKLYRISVLAKTDPQQKAEDYFALNEIVILSKLTGREIKKVEDYILALGTLTNFERSAKQPLPGEKLLWQALKIFENIKKGVLLANIYGRAVIFTKNSSTHRVTLPNNFQTNECRVSNNEYQLSNNQYHFKKKSPPGSIFNLKGVLIIIALRVGRLRWLYPHF